jgi:hypothetical protein
MAYNTNRFEANADQKRPIGECAAEIASLLWKHNVVDPVHELINRKDVHQVNTTYAMSKGYDPQYDAYADA